MQRTPELLRLLLDHEVHFVLIGGVAAIAHGSASFTQDCDITAPLTVENLTRLMAALGPHHPRYAMTIAKRPVLESPAALAENKNLYLVTDLGRLDIVSEVAPVGSYDRVAARAISVDLYGRQCQVISLDDLIAVKHHLGREKDRTVERELRALRDIRNGSNSD